MKKASKIMLAALACVVVSFPSVITTHAQAVNKASISPTATMNTQKSTTIDKTLPSESAIIHNSEGTTINPATKELSGSLENFPTRKVTILPTYSDGSSHTELLRAINQKTREPFRYPYYEVNDTYLTTSTVTPTISNLENIARDTNSDIVIVPVLNGWSYYTFHHYGGFWDDDDEIYVYANAKVSIYSYNKANASVRVDSASYFNVDDSLTVPSEPEVLQIVMDRVLKKLPYKRIPTDIPRYNPSSSKDSTTAPEVVPSAVDSPYPLPDGIQQF